MRVRTEPWILPSGTEIAAGYTVLAHLSRGKRLDVYDVWSNERSCRCVAKALRPDRVTEARPRRALLAEGRLLRRMTHPHLVRAYEVTEASDGSGPVVILETLGGETLSHLLDRLDGLGRRMPVPDAMVLGTQLWSAMNYLHAHDRLHLDLKPGNIIAEGGRAKVIDLSIAQRPGRGRRGRGTHLYMAPEQAEGGWVSAAADVWGIGIVLYEGLTGRGPFEDDDVARASDERQTGETADLAGGTSGDALNAGREEAIERDSSIGFYRDRGEYPQLQQRAPSIGRFRRLPAAVATLIDDCLEQDPVDRPPMRELGARLTALAGPGTDT